MRFRPTRSNGSSAPTGGVEGARRGPNPSAASKGSRRAVADRGLRGHALAELLRPALRRVAAPVDDCRKDQTYAAPLFVAASSSTTRPVRSRARRSSWATSMMTEGHVHHQHRACRRVARPLAGWYSTGQDKAAENDLTVGHPRPRCVARVRPGQARHRRCPHRPQAPPAGHRAAEGTRLDQRADHGALRLLRDHDVDVGEGQHRRLRRGCWTSTASCARASRRPESAQTLLENLEKRYDLARVGR